MRTAEEDNWLEDAYESTSYDKTVEEEQKFVEEALYGLQSQWGEAQTFVRDKKVLDQYWSIEDSSDRERIRWKQFEGQLFEVDDLEKLDIEITRGGVSVNGFIGALAAVAGRCQQGPAALVAGSTVRQRLVHWTRLVVRPCRQPGGRAAHTVDRAAGDVK